MIKNLLIKKTKNNTFINVMNTEYCHFIKFNSIYILKYNIIFTMENIIFFNLNIKYVQFLYIFITYFSVTFFIN